MGGFIEALKQADRVTHPFLKNKSDLGVTLWSWVAPFSVCRCATGWTIWFPARAFRPLKSAKKKQATAFYPHTERTAPSVDVRSLRSVCVQRRPGRLPATALSGGSQLHSTIKDLRLRCFCPLPSPTTWGELQLMCVESEYWNLGQKKYSGVTWCFCRFLFFLLSHLHKA